MPEKKEKPKLKFKYKISPNYALYSISGLHGGLNAQGDIILNLFSERQAIPKEETYQIQDDGSLCEKPIEVDKVDAVIRDVLFGISLHPASVRSIAKWLNDKADEFDRLWKKENEGKK